MKVEVINPFIEASQSVFKMLCGIEVTLGRIYLRNSSFSVNQVVVMIGLVGKIRGKVYFELSIDTTKRMASIMMGGIPIVELDEIGKSAISEVVNMIMGNTSMIFANKNINIDITPPSLFMKEKIEISNEVSTVVIPLELEGLGTIAINVAVEEIIYM
jgi:chemotaxis protein CheX